MSSVIVPHAPKTSAVKANSAAEITHTRNLPIVMYHKILNNRRGKYTVTVDQIKADFAAILDAGFTPVFMSEVIDFVEGDGKLPPKPIVITFDDGFYNNVSYGLPIAKELGVKFMIYPVTSFSKLSMERNEANNPSYSHLTWEQMKEAKESGLVEFGNHSHKMHNLKPRYGIAKMSSESDAHYVQELKQDIETAQNFIEQSGVGRPNSFAYPFGKYSTRAKELLLEMGFHALLSCNEKVSVIEKGKPETLHCLGRFNRAGSYTTKELMNKLTQRD
jgi:peptidoglycan/xylan/chitin deacetylase (PgdA/CDA1 family)